MFREKSWMKWTWRSLRFTKEQKLRIGILFITKNAVISLVYNTNKVQETRKGWIKKKLPVLSFYFLRYGVILFFEC